MEFETEKHLKPKRIGLAVLVLLCLNAANVVALPVTFEREAQAQKPASSDVDEITRLNQQVVLLVDQGKLDEALLAGKQALDSAAKRLGSEHCLVGLAAHNLATVYFAKKQYSDAAKFYQRSLSIYEKTLSPIDPRLADELYGLGWSSYAIGETTKTERHLPANLIDVSRHLLQ